MHGFGASEEMTRTRGPMVFRNLKYTLSSLHIHMASSRNSLQLRCKFREGWLLFYPRSKMSTVEKRRELLSVSKD